MQPRKQTSSGLSTAMFAPIALLALASGAAHAAQVEEPDLTCSIGEAPFGPFSGTLAVAGTTPLPDSIQHNMNFAVPMSSVEMTVWSSVGHPESGCLIGGDAGDADDGNTACDQTEQQDEEFLIDAFGISNLLIPDHGTDQWESYSGNPIVLGPQPAGLHPVTFHHTNESTNDTPESVTYKALVCAVPAEWDKSSLSFRGPTTVENGIVSAEICNGGEDMLAPSTWELYYAARGNPKNGTVIDSGVVPALDNGECTTLSAPDQGLVGNFKFKAYQAAGHPGLGVLWSD